MPTVAELSIEVTVKDQGAQEDILKLQQMLQRLATEDPDISVRVSAEAAKKEFDRLREEIVWLEGNTVDIQTDLQAKQAMAQLEELQRKMRELDRSTVGVDVDIDTTGALLHLAIFKEELKQLSKERIKVDEDNSAFKSLNQISAAAQRASGTIRGLTTAIIALSPALVPIGAVGVTGLVALTGAAVAAGAGVGLFAAVAITAFGPVVDVIKKMTAAQLAYDQAVTDKQREAALAKLKALYDSLDPAQQALVKSFMQMRDAWGDFVAKFRPEIFQIATEAMQQMTQFIPLLAPLMENATKAIHNLQTEAFNTFKSPVWQEFFDNLTNGTGPAIESFGRILLNLATGFAGILNAFFPFQSSFLGGLEEMTAKFAIWGTNLENNPGFKKFIAYVKENAPLLKDLLRSIADAFVALVVAAAPIGENLLKIFKKVSDGIALIGEKSSLSLTGILAFAGIAAVFVNMIGPILAVANVIDLLLPLFALIWSGISAGAGIVASFLTGWGEIIAIIGLVVGAFVLAYQHFDKFRAKVDEIVAKLKEMGQGIMNALKPALDTVIQYFQQEWAKFAQWWQDNSATFNVAWENIKKAAEAALTFIADVILNALNVIQAVWNFIWPGLSDVLSGVWSVITGIISGAFEIIRGIFTVFAGILAGDWDAVWRGLVGILSGVWTAIYGILSGAVQIVWGILQILWGVVKAAWDLIVGAFSSGGSAAVGVLTAAFNGVVSFFQWIWDGLVSGAQAFVDAIVGAFQWLYDVLVGHSIVPDLVNAIIGWWNTLVAFLSSVMAPVVAALVAAWNAIKAAVETAVQAVLTVVTTVWNTLVAVSSAVWNSIVSVVSSAINNVSTVISSVISAISATWSAIWTGISQVAQVVWQAIQSFVQIGIFAVKAIVAATMAAIQGDWSTAWNIISNAASTIWAAIKSVVTNAIQQVQSIIQNTLNTIKSIWTSLWNSLVDAVKSAGTSVVGAVTTFINNAVNAVRNAASAMFSAGASFVGGLIDGIQSKAAALAGAVGSLVSKMAAPLPGSPADIGPLSGHGYVKLRAQRFVDDLSTGLSDTSGLRLSMKDIADIVSLNANPTAAFDAITSPLNSMAGAFGSATAPQGGSSITIAPGAIVIQIPSGMDPSAARAAFDGAQDTMADALLVAIKKRQSS